MAHKLGLHNQVSELKLGKSFTHCGSNGFHTVRYDFKPASVDPTKMATVDISDNNQVRVTVPHIESSGTNATLFQGSKKPYQKECVLIIDHVTGTITLEKLDSNIQLKKTRAEGSGKKYMQRPVTPIEHSKAPGMKPSPTQRFTSSPSGVSHLSPNTNSPAHIESPKQPSPVQTTSPVCHAAAPTANSSASSSYPQRKTSSPPVKVANSMPTFSQLVYEVPNNVEDTGILSDSSDSDSDYAQNSFQASDSGKANNSPPSSVHKTSLPDMPQLSQLSEDLQLSESDSD